MQTLNQSHVMGLIEFKSNEIDQSPAFLRTALASLLNAQNLRFTIHNPPVWELQYDTEYYFEDFVEDQLRALLTRPLLFDNLITYNPQLKKIHPKSQFDQLKINVVYREINEYAQFVQSGAIKLELAYDTNSDRIRTIIHQNTKNVHEYNAKNIQGMMHMDAIDTFTHSGIRSLIWHLNNYTDGWRYNAEDFPILDRVINHHKTLDDPETFYLDVFKHAHLNTIVRTDVQSYFENEIEQHLDISPIVQKLLTRSNH